MSRGGWRAARAGGGAAPGVVRRDPGRCTRCGWRSRPPTCSGPRAATGAPGLDVSGLDGVIEVDAEAPDRRRAGHVHLRAPRRRDAAARPDPATSCRSCAPSPSAARSPASASSRPASATACRTSRCSRWTSSPAPARSSRTRPGDDLFDAFPNSYGSLGYATRLRIELERVPATSRCGTSASTTPGCSPRPSPRSSRPGEYDGQRVDGLDGVAFEPGEYYLTLAALDRRATAEPTGPQRLHRPADLLPVDPAARIDRPADHVRLPVALGHRLVLVLGRVRRPAPASSAGCGRGAGGAPTSTTGCSRSRPHRFSSPTGSTAAQGRPQRERVVQDVEVPVERLAEFLDWFDAEVGMRPVWLCPLVRPAPHRRPGRPTRCEPGTHLRQRRLLGHRPRRARGARRARATARSRRRSTSSAATSRSTPRRSTTARPSTGSTTAPTSPP